MSHYRVVVMPFVSSETAGGSSITHSEEGHVQEDDTQEERGVRVSSAPVTGERDPRGGERHSPFSFGGVSAETRCVQTSHCVDKDRVHAVSPITVSCLHALKKTAFYRRQHPKIFCERKQAFLISSLNMGRSHHNGPMANRVIKQTSSGLNRRLIYFIL